VLNVAGHRLGTMEVESALVSHARVAESAVVGKPHEIKGEGIFAYVVCRGARPSGEEAKKLVEELRAWVSKELGAIAKPDEIRFTDNLPKTRSGKIMRRLLRAIARGEEISQDISTLENPQIIAQLRGEGMAAERARSPARTTASKGATKPVKKAVKKAVKKVPKPVARKAVKRRAGGKPKPAAAALRRKRRRAR
jgi:hypothetical protein